MKSTAKKLLEVAEFLSALLYSAILILRRDGTRRTIVYYHSVQKKDINRFEKQMEYLAKNCHVVNVSEIGEAQADARYTVAITFDDAFVSVLENAVPVLKRHGLSAGIFVPTGNLGQSPRWEMPENCPDKNEIVMNRDQLAELADDNISIFSHSVSHPIFTLVDNDMLKNELEQSKNTLEEILGYEIVGISYPHGAHDDRVCRLVMEVGYKLGFTTEPTMVDNNADPLKIGRFSVSPSDSLLKFRLKVNGAYQITKYLRCLKAKAFRLMSRIR